MSPTPAAFSGLQSVFVRQSSWWCLPVHFSSAGTQGMSSTGSCELGGEMREGVGLEGGLVLAQPLSIWEALVKSLHSSQSVLCVMRVLSLGLKENHDVDFMPEKGMLEMKTEDEVDFQKDGTEEVVSAGVVTLSFVVLYKETLLLL
ncbi:hypothetical protein DV515_00006434 [Chloebia gouldiae]|uniref:Uncharacterized protein n=1 Tax=Chloebia gouldiae TaxID=44316 RepID=A0A3L8SLL4_CHLGU|nr:hypothetical protein DV515_00006434 [Chloebia gouldiae]